MYLIDSDILIYSSKSYPEVTGHFQRTAHLTRAISVITLGELLYGAKKSLYPEKSTIAVLRSAEFMPVIDVSQPIVETYASLKADLHKKGALLDDLDILIAATALSLNYTLVTNNEKHFSRIPGLRWENWTKSFPPPQAFHEKRGLYRARKRIARSNP